MIEIQLLNEADGGGLIGYYAKGHHDPDRFVRELRKQRNVEFGKKGLMILPRHVEQKWWRNVPAPWLDDPAPILMYDAKPFSRGAYRVTVIDLDKAWRTWMLEQSGSRQGG